MSFRNKIINRSLIPGIKTKSSIIVRAHFIIVVIRAWPSGKAPGFGPGIRGFESLRPSQSKKVRPCVWLSYFARRARDSNGFVRWTNPALGFSAVLKNGRR